MPDWNDPEALVVGYEEIDRKRSIITRVLSGIQSHIQRTSRDWPKDTCVVSVNLDHHRALVFKVGKKRAFEADDLLFELHYAKETRWLQRYGDSLHHTEVPVVFSGLRAFLHAANEAVPEAKLKELGEFFVAQVPNR